MKSSFSLGTIAGVAVGVNWSVLVIAGLVTVSLAGGILPMTAPDYPPAAYLVGGLIGAVGLLAAILVHELGHAVVARRNGVQVDRITLWLFGGVAQLEGEMSSPSVELKVAGVGPAISLLLGAALLTPGLLVSGLAGAVLAWLGAINLILAVFNLIPGAPLDGGRLLHAWLWRRHGDRARATATATKAGRVVGAGLIGLGGYQFLVGSVGGLWTALIGWVLIRAATAEGQYARLQQDLGVYTVRQVMSPAEPVLPGWLSVAAFIDRHVVPGRQLYVLGDIDGNVTGVVTLDALGTVSPAARLTTSLRRLARPAAELPTVQAGDRAARLLQQMKNAPLALVQEHGRIVGTITASQLAAAAASARLLGGVSRD